MLVLCKTINDFKKAIAKPGPLLGIDHGLARLGVSVSDSERVFALPHSVIIAAQINALVDVILHKGIVGVVVGYPLELSGEVGSGCEAVDEFLKKVNNYAKKTEVDLQIPCYLQDERFTTKLSNTMLKQAKLKRKKRAVEDNAVAASNILQTALDVMKNL